MAKKKVTRKALLKEPDEFLTLSGRVAGFVREHSQLFAYLGVAVAAAILIYLGINTFMGHVNQKGQSAFNEAFYALAKNTDPEMAPKDLRASAELFQQVIDKYGMAKVSRLALPELAYLKVLEKKYDEAIPLYEKFLNEVSDNTPYQSLGMLALAACYEATGDLEKAIQTLNQLAAAPNALFKEEALLSLARVYRLADQKDKSKETLQEFVEKYKNSRHLALAKTHLERFHP